MHKLAYTSCGVEGRELGIPTSTKKKPSTRPRSTSNQLRSHWRRRFESGTQGIERYQQRQQGERGDRRSSVQPPAYPKDEATGAEDDGCTAGRTKASGGGERPTCRRKNARTRYPVCGGRSGAVDEAHQAERAEPSRRQRHWHTSEFYSSR